jgi:hypothetical protein
MSLQFVDKVRFELNEIDSMFNSIGLNKMPTCSSPQAQHHPSPTTNKVPNPATYPHSNSTSTNTSTNSNTNSNKNTNTSTSTTSNSNPAKLISSQESKKPKHTIMPSYQPKIPSNLVKSSIPSFSTAAASTSSSGIQDVMLYDRKQLLDFLAERQDNLLKTRSEYECQFENFFSLSKKFHSEKLTNLKLTFKNQILK